MAIVTPKIEHMGGSAVRVTWQNMLNGDVGAEVSYTLHQDRSVQVVGTLGVGGSVTMNGSNDGINFVPLTDLRGNNLVLTAPRIEQIEDCSFALKPSVVGDGSTNVTVILFARKGD